MSVFRSFLILSMFLSTAGYAQNLVPNPNFEDYSSTYCGIMFTGEFASSIDDWEQANGASPDAYFTNIDPSCYNFQPQSEYDGVIGIKGSQLPLSGEVMAGLWLYTIAGSNQREYLQVELTAPMVSGQEYVVEFYVSLADSMEFYIDKLGAHLSVGVISGTDDGPLDYTPQVEADGFVSDAENWTLISDTVMATDDFTHITIGNFYDDDATATMSNPLHSQAVSTYGAYYFVEDIKVEQLNDVGIYSTAFPHVQVYPTLAEDVLHVRIPTVIQSSEIKIYDTTGQLVRLISTRDELTQIEVSDLAKGVYLVNVISGANFATRSVVKQ